VWSFSCIAWMYNVVIHLLNYWESLGKYPKFNKQTIEAHRVVRPPRFPYFSRQSSHIWRWHRLTHPPFFAHSKILGTNFCLSMSRPKYHRAANNSITTVYIHINDVKVMTLMETCATRIYIKNVCKELIDYWTLIRHWSHRQRRLQQFFFV
jgi:hypothetical protein